MVTLWDKAQHIKINSNKKKVGNFDIGFDKEIPEKFRNRMRNVIVWLENNYNFPITIWVDFEYKNYLISREKKRVGYLFHWFDFKHYPDFTDNDEIPDIRLPIKGWEEGTHFEEILISFFTAITYYFCWLLNEDVINYKANDEEVDFLVDKYLEYEKAQNQ